MNILTYTKNNITKTNHHLYIAPCPELKNVVAHYTITFPNPSAPIPANSVLHLIPDVSGCFVFEFEETLSITVWGATTQVVTVVNDLNQVPCRFFVEFLPAGLYQILGEDMASLLNQKIDLKILNSHLFETIKQAVSNLNTFDELVDQMNQILVQALKYPIQATLLDWIETIYKDQVNVNSHLIATDLKISERQVSRYFNRYVGMGLKKYSKIASVNHVIQDLSKRELLDLSLDYDYFDQAHFNHVFKQICGTSPTQYLSNLSDFYNELFKF